VGSEQIVVANAVTGMCRSIVLVDDRHSTHGQERAEGTAQTALGVPTGKIRARQQQLSTKRFAGLEAFLEDPHQRCLPQTCRDSPYHRIGARIAGTLAQVALADADGARAHQHYLHTLLAQRRYLKDQAANSHTIRLAVIPSEHAAPHFDDPAMTQTRGVPRGRILPYFDLRTFQNDGLL
jgi:hypothetical protein